MSRSLALALAALTLLGYRSRPALLLLASVMALVQLGDTVVGFAIHDPMKTYGPLFLAVVTAWAAWQLARAKA